MPKKIETNFLPNYVPTANVHNQVVTRKYTKKRISIVKNVLEWSKDAQKYEYGRVLFIIKWLSGTIIIWVREKKAKYV